MALGLPYKGSKNAIAKKLIDALPPGGTFYDLFCGGGAMTHAAMLSGKYSRFVMNDIDAELPELFRQCATGEFQAPTEWISRKDFKARRDSDVVVRYLWSFGNNGEDYLYSREVEPWKKAVHYARVFGDRSLLAAFGIDSDGSMADIKAHHDEYKEKYVRWYIENVMHTTQADAERALLEGAVERESERLRQYLRKALKASGLKAADVDKRLGTQMSGHYFGKSQWAFPTKEEYEKMQVFMPALDQPYDEIAGLKILAESLQGLQRLQSLQGLQSLQRLQTFSGDYQAVPIEGTGLIYCDIPYRGTNEYTCGGFDFERFYDWCERQTLPVYVSEYWMPPERFKCVAEIKKLCTLSGTLNNKETTERLFVPVNQASQNAGLFV